MKSFSELPIGYTEHSKLDLQKNKKALLIVNLLAILITVVMMAPMFSHWRLSIFYYASYVENGMMVYAVKILIFFALAVIYMVLHMLIIGVAMKIGGTKKVKYGFTGLYAYTGSKDYYDKTTYIFIAFAPFMTFLVLLAIINFLVPPAWFLTVYFIQTLNVSGAAGNIYVTCKLLKMPKDTLVQDSGVSMTFYTKGA